MKETITVEIYGYSELEDKRKKYKLSQSKICEIMGMSKKSYKAIRRYRNGEQEILDWTSWKKLNDFVDKQENKTLI